MCGQRLRRAAERLQAVLRGFRDRRDRHHPGGRIGGRRHARTVRALHAKSLRGKVADHPLLQPHRRGVALLSHRAAKRCAPQPGGRHRISALRRFFRAGRNRDRAVRRRRARRRSRRVSRDPRRGIRGAGHRRSALPHAPRGSSGADRRHRSALRMDRVLRVGDARFRDRLSGAHRFLHVDGGVFRGKSHRSGRRGALHRQEHPGQERDALRHDRRRADHAGRVSRRICGGRADDQPLRYGGRNLCRPQRRHLFRL